MDAVAKVTITKYHEIIIPVVSVVIGLGILGFVIIPQAMGIPATNAQVDGAQQKLILLKNKVNILKSVDTAKIQDDYDISLAALPADREIPGSFDQILLALRTKGMSFTDIVFSNTVRDDAGAESYPIKIEVKGTREDVNDVVESFKDSVRLIKVDRIETAANRSSDEVQAVIGFRAYFKSEPKTSSNLDTDTPVETLNQSSTDVLNKVKELIAKNQNIAPDASASGSIGNPDPFNY